MDRFLLEIYLPPAMRSFEVKVPADSTLSQIAPLIAKGLAQLSHGYYMQAENTVVCDFDTGKILDVNKCLWELGLRTGSKLLLI